MSKIYMLGDFVSNTGPAIVNKNYSKHLGNRAYICKSNNKIIRIIHFICFIYFADVLLISGLSKFHVYACQIAKILNKRTYYLMHGYTKMENSINKKKNSPNERIEEQLLEIVDNILCVSEKFSIFLKERLSKYTNKIDFVNNGVDFPSESLIREKNNNKFNIISIGGGKKIKCNLNVCKAIERLNKNDINFIIIGTIEGDGERIKAYKFVEYYEKLPHDEVLKLLQNSNLYVQNSIFETFGMGVVEAIACGCNILISKDVGAISIMDNISQNNIIVNTFDIDEIAKKIECIYNKKNEINNFIDYKKYSWESATKTLLQKMNI